MIKPRHPMLTKIRTCVRTMCSLKLSGTRTANSQSGWTKSVVGQSEMVIQPPSPRTDDGQSVHDYLAGQVDIEFGRKSAHEDRGAALLGRSTGIVALILTVATFLAKPALRSQAW